MELNGGPGNNINAINGPETIQGCPEPVGKTPKVKNSDRLRHLCVYSQTDRRLKQEDKQKRGDGDSGQISELLS